MNKKIWITGASSGIGKSLAIKFAREGWQVAASARRTKLLEELNQNDSNIHPFPLDVKNEDITKKEFDKLVSKLQSIDLQNVVEEVDNTDLSGELACAGGSCEITSL